MGLADLFRPKHRHSDVRVRSEAVRLLGRDDADVLTQVARTDRDPAIRRIAIEKLAEPEVLADIAGADTERSLRDLAGARAAELWSSVACGENAEAAGEALAGLIKLGDQRALVDAAARAAVPAIRKRALTELRDPRALAELAKAAAQHETRLEAVARIDDAEVLRALATDTTHKEVGLAAVDKLDEPELLESVAQKAKTKAIRQRARKIVTEMEEAERAAKPTVPDEVKRRRAEKAQLVRQVEAVAESFDFAHATEVVLAAEKEWAVLGGDDDANDKFAALTRRFWTRKDVHDQTLDQRRTSAEIAAAPDPALRAAEMAAAIEPAVERVEPDDPAREARDRENAERRAAREAQRAEDEARRKAEAEDRAARAKEDAERGKELGASLAALAGEMEALLESKDGRAIDRLLTQAARAFAQLGKVVAAERAALADRYDRVRGALVIRSKDLREAEDWQRFSNVPKADALIKEAQALLEAEATPELGNKLKALQARWKEVGAIPHQKSKTLWEQFKATCDQVYAKVVERRAGDQVKFAESAAIKERLIAEAEALADSTDWDATANRLKALQGEWKTSGHLPRKQGDELWRRFRAACDKFFERRKPQLDAVRGEQVANLEAKAAMCARIEAVVEAAPGERGWGFAITEVKNAQRDWREIGFVPRADADAIYRRFRAACDALFAKRDAARDAEADVRRGELDAIRTEIEAILASDGADAVARAVAVRGKVLADERPSIEMAGLVDRMIRHVVATQPDAVKGTALDPAATVARRRALIERAEELLPKAAPTVSADQSPESIAERLKSAMRANAFGGLRFTGRDPIEVIHELRAEWAAAGPALGDEAAELETRFAAVIAEASAAAGVDPDRASRDDHDHDRGDREDRGDRRRVRRERRADRQAERAADTATEIAATPAVEPAAVIATVAAAAEPVVAPAPEPAPVAPVPVPEPAPTPVVVASPPAEPKMVPLSEREPLPPPPPPPILPAEPPVEAAPPARTSSLTQPPPMDDVDNAWDDEPAATPPAEPAPPGAGELAGDGAVESDHLDVD